MNMLLLMTLVNAAQVTPVRVGPMLIGIPTATSPGFVGWCNRLPLALSACERMLSQAKTGNGRGAEFDADAHTIVWMFCLNGPHVVDALAGNRIAFRHYADKVVMIVGRMFHHLLDIAVGQASGPLDLARFVDSGALGWHSRRRNDRREGYFLRYVTDERQAQRDMVQRVSFECYFEWPTLEAAHEYRARGMQPYTLKNDARGNGRPIVHCSDGRYRIALPGLCGFGSYDTTRDARLDATQNKGFGPICKQAAVFNGRKIGEVDDGDLFVPCELVEVFDLTKSLETA